mmetsp:Transcript_23890/g.46280  ORF Transcript_23890/g.46280 Transcript_23890/m.46280 type:complete len:174 (-) Transcript_23890:260-781(-)
MLREIAVGLLVGAAVVEGFSPAAGLRSVSTRSATPGPLCLEMKSGKKRAAVKKFFTETLLRKKPAAEPKAAAKPAAAPKKASAPVQAPKAVAKVEAPKEAPKVEAPKPVAKKVVEVPKVVEEPPKEPPKAAEPVKEPYVYDPGPQTNWSKKFDDIMSKRQMSLTQRLKMEDMK